VEMRVSHFNAAQFRQSEPGEGGREGHYHPDSRGWFQLICDTPSRSSQPSRRKGEVMEIHLTFLAIVLFTFDRDRLKI
jgi:hypothetical protein